MRLEESTHHDQEITRVAKQVATLLESRLSLRLKRRDGDEWLDALNDRRSRRLKARGGRRVIAVEGLYDARALLEALVWDEVARGLLTAEGRRAADILRQLATKAAHQGPEVRRPEAAEQAFALGQQVLGAAGIPESALGGGGAEAEATSPRSQVGRPAVPPASADPSPQATPRTSARDGGDTEAAAPQEAASPPGPPSAGEPPEPSRPLLPAPVPPTAAQLAWRADPETEELVLLEPGGRPYVIGRDFDCDVLLHADLGVSRRHAQVDFEEGSWSLADLGSKNGTRLDGIAVSERTRLRDGVRMRVGRTDLCFELLG